MLTATTRLTDNHLGGILAITAASAAAAGGLIHVNQIGSHLDFPLIAAGFALMGAAQWAFGVAHLLYPSHRVLVAGGVLHAGIFILWLVTRTVGLGFVPGAEVPADVGVADLVANAFSLVVVGVTAIGMARHGATNALVVPPSVATRVKAVVLSGAVFLTVLALIAPHDHGTHPVDASNDQTSQSHDHASGAASHAESGHTHSSDDSAPTTHP